MSGLDKSKKEKIIRRFDMLAPERQRWRDRNPYYYADQERYFKFLIPEGASILELGCGTGNLLDALRPKRAVGIDISPEMVKVARARYPELEFLHADMESLDPWGETFDYLIMNDVVGHLLDIGETLRRLRSFCRQDTRVIISYYNFMWEPVLRIGEMVNLKMPQQYQNWLSTEDVCNLLILALFQVVKTECRLLIPKRIPWVSDFANRYFASLPGVKRLCLCRYVVARPLHLNNKKQSTTTILIPCRNERGNIAAAVRRIPEFGGHQEILFVEGGSKDGTPEEIERVKKDYPDKDIKLLYQDGKGKGDAVRKGFSAAIQFFHPLSGIPPLHVHHRHQPSC